MWLTIICAMTNSNVKGENGSDESRAGPSRVNAGAVLTILVAGASLAFMIQFRKYEKGNDDLVNLSLLILLVTSIATLFCARAAWSELLRGVFGVDTRKKPMTALAPFLPIVLLAAYPLCGPISWTIRFRAAALAVALVAFVAAICVMAGERHGARKPAPASLLWIFALFSATLLAALLGNGAHNLQKHLAGGNMPEISGNDAAEIALDRDIRLASRVGETFGLELEAVMPEHPFVVISVAAGRDVGVFESCSVSLRAESEYEKKDFQFEIDSLFIEAREKWKDCVLDLTGFGGQDVRLTLDLKRGAGGARLWRGLSRRSDFRLALLRPAWNWRRDDTLFVTTPRIVDGIDSPGAFNIMLISLDTLRADHLSLYGYSRETAPGLSALAKEGVFFANFFSPATWTLPAHMSLFTSLYPSAHRIHIPKKRVERLERETLPELLRSAGFYTVSFNDSGLVGSTYGFHGGFDAFDETREGIDSKIGKAADWISEHRAIKFFMFLHTYEIHDYFNRKPEHVEFYGKDYAGRIRGSFLEIIKNPRARDEFAPRGEDVQFVLDLYDGAIRHTDRYLQDLFSVLRESGVYENTMIIVTSDHGESFDEAHDNGRVAAWHHGGRPYDEQMRIPLIIKMPAQHAATRDVVASPHSFVDIMPTLAEMLKLEPEGRLQGVSFAPALLGDRDGAWDRPIISMSAQANLNAILSVRGGGFKYISKAGADEELYDLESDPFERKNLAGAEQWEDKTEEFSKLLKDYLEACEEYETETHLEDTIPDDVKKQLKALGYL